MGRSHRVGAVRAFFVLAFAFFAAMPARAQDEPTDTPAAATPAPGQPPAGWTSNEAFELAGAALAAAQAGKLDVCIEKNKDSLKIEDQPRTRLLLASCEARAGHLIDSLGDAQKANTAGITRRDVPVMRAARQRIADLLTKIPHVTFVPPAGATGLRVAFDERAVPPQSLTKKFSIDPGRHVVHAEGTLEGLPLTFDQEYEVKEGDLLTVQIALTSQTSEYLTAGQLKCMIGAKNPEDVLKCVPQKRTPLIAKAGFGVSGYSDTDHVAVFSPEINGSISSPTAGWNVGATYLIDVVSAASPDIVSEASPPFHEVRQAGTLTGGYKPGLYGAQASADISREPDYLSVGAGLAVTADLHDKLITPRFAYNYGHDTIGRTDTPFRVFHHILLTNGFEGGTSLILSPTSLIVLSATLQFENGDQSKPYRYVPMFSPNIARIVPSGASVDLVNANRLALRPLEQLPISRQRFAVGARFVHRFANFTKYGSATLRLEQRIYDDSWALKAWTTDGQFLVDLGRRLRVWPHVRLNAQSGANFYELAYSAATAAGGAIVVPTYRTTDRELSPLIAATLGAGGRYALTSPEAKTQYALSLQGDSLFSYYFDALFVRTRTAVYGTLGIDAEFQ